ncbi:MAG: hypothetical protein N2117_07905 [Anaerolineales bacterium]|nr:hypothetical protein [Anaerolineales bacterium]
MQVAFFDGKSQPLAFFGTSRLIRRRRADGGIEGDVGRAVGRARFDVASPPPFGNGFGAPPGFLARQFIQRGIQFAGGKGFARLDLLPTFPPVGVLGGKNILPGGFGCSALGVFFYLVFI